MIYEVIDHHMSFTKGIVSPLMGSREDIKDVKDKKIIPPYFQSQ